MWMGLAWCWAAGAVGVAECFPEGPGKRPRVPSITWTSWSYPQLGTGLCCRQRRQPALGPLSPGHAWAPLNFCYFFHLPDWSLGLLWLAFYW